MKSIFFYALMLVSLGVAQSAFSIELNGAPVARSPSATSSQSGTVVKIDAKSGLLMLDGARRFTFSPGGGVSVHRSNGASAKMAEVRVGASVRLAVINNPGYVSSQVAELWIVE